MESHGFRELIIDNEFKTLIRPLQKKEYLQLEDNLLADGCLDPIVTWNDIIIDGHNRYEICCRHHIPFEVYEMSFESREEAIAWICAHQLGRRNITEETRKFLIGMQYETEKIVNCRKNAYGINQYSTTEEMVPMNEPSELAEESVPSGHRTAQRIAEENHVSYNTVQKYAIYTRALEIIGKKVPEIVPKILSGRYKISHNNVVELSRLNAEQIKKVVKRIEETQQPFIRYKSTRREVEKASESTPARETAQQPSVKDMPAFDPDAEITGLALTIPSWSSSIDRTKQNANFALASIQAKSRLQEALYELDNKITDILSAIKED